MSCNGHSQIDCTNRRCAKGTVKDYRVDRIGKNTVTGEDIFQRVAIRVKCDTCNGSGLVNCGACDNGRE